MTSTPLHIAIIGGGFSGAAVALHLAKTGFVKVSVFEPRQEIGRGLAYDSQEPVHRINVPAHKMSLYPDAPDSFADYLAKNPPQDDQLYAPSGEPYPQRSVFGDYVHSEIAPYLADKSISHIRRAVVSAQHAKGVWLIRDDQTQIYKADILVIATSHPPPSLPSLFKPLKNHPGLYAEGAAQRDLSQIKPEAKVLVVGNGLTAADVIATLGRHGHYGPITALSRRGLRSKGHAPCAQELNLTFLPAPSSALSLLKELRRQLAQAEALGRTWHVVFDQLRLEGQEIWRALSLKSRRQIARHLRPFWDVHRFRIAPQIEAVLDQAIAQGRLKIIAAHLKAAQAEGQRLAISYLPRLAKAQVTDQFDAVIVTTGPAHGGILKSQKLLLGLAENGHLSLCPTGLGLLCDERSQAIGSKGNLSPQLYISGPLARGTFGELMGLPQVSDHALNLAQEIILASQRARLDIHKKALA